MSRFVRYDEDQLRDPRTGRWVDGLPDSVVEIAVKLGDGQSAIVAAKPDRPGEATLSAGGRSTSLTGKEIEALRREIIHAQYDMDDRRDGYGLFAVRRRVRADDGGISTVDLVALRPTGKLVSETGKPVKSVDEAPDDEELYNAEFDLFIGGDDGEFGGFGDAPVARVTLKDVDQDNRKGLYVALENASAARRLETGSGQVDLYIPRTGRLALLTQADDAPEEVEFNAGEWRRIDRAISTVMKGFDDDADPDDSPEVSSIEVKTAAGPVVVEWSGPRDTGRQYAHFYHPDARLTIRPQYDSPWRLGIDGDHMMDVLDELGSVAAVAGVGQRSHPASRLRGAGERRRKYDPDQPRDDDGRWTDTPLGERSAYTLDQLDELHGGERIDDRDVGDYSHVFAYDSATVALVNSDDDGRYEPLWDGSGDDARDLADAVERMADGSGQMDPDEDVEPYPNGLVDYDITDDGILVGYDPSGDIIVRALPDPSEYNGESLDDVPGADLDVDDGWSLVDALRDMAGAADEYLPDEGEDLVDGESEDATARQSAPTATRAAGDATDKAPQVHTGAMVALVPSDADVARLAVRGGEPADELHLTLWYLGEAANIPAETQAGLVTAVRSMVDRRNLPVVQARAFGVNMWNPDGPEPAMVLAVGDPKNEELPDGQERLAVVRGMVAEAWHDDMVPLEVPAQHTPWVPHVCLAYSDDPDMVGELLDRTGPITFDRLRVAFGGQNTDIPLAAPPFARSVRRFDPDQPRDDHGRWTDAGGVTSLWKKTTKIGFHYNSVTSGQPRTGFVASLFPERARQVDSSSLTANVLREYRDANNDLMAKKDHYIGLWRERDEETGKDKVWLDANVVYEDRNAAAQAARAAGQDTLFDLANGTPVDVSGEG